MFIKAQWMFLKFVIADINILYEKKCTSNIQYNINIWHITSIWILCEYYDICFKYWLCHINVVLNILNA